MKEATPSRLTAEWHCVPSIEAAPYDVLLEILTLLSAPDIAHLLSTSRALFAYHKEEEIWRTLSRPFGITDVSSFAGRSFYTVYTRLLHRYGPLLGLWAGDRAYSGHIIEFRIDRGGASIVGEFWRFRKPRLFEIDIDSLPEEPYYIPAFRIGFADAHSGDSYDAAESDAVHIICTAPTRGGHPGHIDCADRIMGRTILDGGGPMASIPHPDFPASLDAAWLDCQRPTLPLTPTTAPIPPLPAWIEEIMFTPVRKSRSITLSCASDCVELEYPALSIRVINSIPPRYYPLRNEIQQGIDHHADEWTPESLTGLWLGWYGPHGTECLFVDYDKEKNLLSGFKITGDENVPRGVLSWEVYMQKPCQLTTEEDMLCTRMLGERPSCAIYRAVGGGTTSEVGYM